jgi:hypothetical protein
VTGNAEASAARTACDRIWPPSSFGWGNFSVTKRILPAGAMPNLVAAGAMPNLVAEGEEAIHAGR